MPPVWFLCPASCTDGSIKKFMLFYCNGVYWFVMESHASEHAGCRSLMQKSAKPATAAEQYSVITPTTYSLLTVYALSVHRVCVLWKFMYFCHY